MGDLASAFAVDYAQARKHFGAAAAARTLAIESHVHPAERGAQDEPLAMDVASWGNATARALLVVTSGVHGVEGFGGSGCQVALLRDDAVCAAVARADVAVLFVHAVNPFGFSHLRRTNEDNVDVNRNFRDFDRASPPNALYGELHPTLVPDVWPPTAANSAALGALAQLHGPLALQSAITGGQAEHADGLFYSGLAPAWSNGVLRGVLARHCAGRAHVAWVDLHTGLGPWGHGERIHAGPDDPAAMVRAKAWYGADVTTVHDGSSTSTAEAGTCQHAARDACGRARFTGITLEFGTRPATDVLQALRGDQWRWSHPDADAAVRRTAARTLRDAFFDDDPAWQAMLVAQSRLTVMQALVALRREP